MADIFVSYSRENSEFVRQLFDELVERGREAWVDWEDIPLTADWWQEIQQGIDEADAFLFVISPASIISPVCQLEVQYAAHHKKRLIPVVLGEVANIPNDAATRAALSRRAEEVTIRALLGERDIQTIFDKNQPYLGRHNWIFYDRDRMSMSAFVDTLLEAIDTDLHHVKMHTRWLLRALEWDRGGRSNSQLLTGDTLEAAEVWLAKAVEKEPSLTALHATYIDTSRRAATARQRRLVAGVSIALAVTVVLAIAALIFAQDARTQNAIAQQNESTAIAERNRADENASTAVAAQETAIHEQERANDNAATAIAERNRADQEAQVALSRQYAAQSRDRVRANPDIGLLQALEAVAIQNNSETRSALFSVVQRTASIDKYLRGHTRAIDVSAFSPNGTIVATGDSDGQVFVYDAMDGSTQAQLTHPAEITALYFEDEQFLLTQQNDGRVTRWDWREGTQEVLLNGTESVRRRLRMGGIMEEGAYGVTLAPIADETTYINWTFAGDATDELSLDDWNADILYAVPNPANTWLALSFNDGRIVLLSNQVDDETYIFDDGMIASPVAWSQDNRYAAFSTLPNDGASSVQVFNVTTGEIIGKWAQQALDGQTVYSLAFTPDDRHLVIGTDGGQLLVIDPFSGAIMRERTRVLESGINTLSISPDSRLVLAGGDSANAVLWAWQDDAGYSPQRLPMTTAPHHLSVQAGYLATSRDNQFVVADTVTDEVLVNDSMLTVREAQLSADASRLVTRHDAAPYLRVWQVVDDVHQLLHTYDELDQMPPGMTVTQNHILAMVDVDTLRVYDMANPQRLHEVQLPRELSAFVSDLDTYPLPLDVSADGQHVAVGLIFDGVVVYDLDSSGTLSNERLFTVEQGSTETIVVATAVGSQHIAAGYLAGDVVIWNLDDDSRTVLTEHGSLITTLDFSPDASLLASASSDKVLRIWMPGTPLAQTFRLGDALMLPDNVRMLQFDHTGEKLHFIQENRRDVWQVPLSLSAWQRTACQRINWAITETEWSQWLPERPYAPLCDVSSSDYPQHQFSEPAFAEATASSTNNPDDEATPETDTRAGAIDPAEFQSRIDEPVVNFQPLFAADIVDDIADWYIWNGGSADLIELEIGERWREIGFTASAEEAFVASIYAESNPDFFMNVFQSVGTFDDVPGWLATTAQSPSLRGLQRETYAGVDIYSYALDDNALLFFIYGDIHVTFSASGIQDVTAAQEAMHRLAYRMIDTRRTDS
jgi:WD40 repeat protein